MSSSSGATLSGMTAGVVSYESPGVVTIKHSNLMLNGVLLIIAICFIVISVIGMAISKQTIGVVGSTMVFILGSILAYLSYAKIINEIEIIRNN